MIEEDFAETMMSIMSDLHDYSHMMQDVLERCELIHAMDDDPMVHARHRHEWDIEAAMVGNTWMADSCLSEYAYLVNEATPWVGTMSTMLIEDDAVEDVHTCLATMVSLMITGAERAKRILDRFGEAIEDNIIADVKEALQIFEKDVHRKTVLEMIKEDAYSDPSVAALAELTKGGLKTRNRFYKRD
jgi:hypothetical protein